MLPIIAHHLPLATTPSPTMPPDAESHPATSFGEAHWKWAASRFQKMRPYQTLPVDAQLMD